MRPLPFLALIALILIVAIVIQLVRSSATSKAIAFSTTLNSSRTVTDTRAWAVTSFASALRDAGYSIESQAERQLTFTRVSRSGGTRAATILLFPIGLLFFFANRRTANITLLLSENATGSQALISGEAPQKLVRQIEAASA